MRRLMSDGKLKDRFGPLLDSCSDSMRVIGELKGISMRGEKAPEALAVAIESDEMLCQQFLRMANSALYAEYPGKAETVAQAISLLGLMMTEEFVTSIAVFNSVNALEDHGIFDARAFCSRAVFCGTAARNLARSAFYHAPEEAFIAGLIHDSGKAFLLASISNDDGSQTEIADAGLKGLEAEADVFGFDHCDVGRFIAEEWNLSPKISAILSEHHRKKLGPGERCEFQLLDLIYVAGRIFEDRVSDSDISDSNRTDTSISLKQEAESLLGISGGDLETVVDESLSMAVQMADCLDLKFGIGERIRRSIKSL